LVKLAVKSNEEIETMTRTSTQDLQEEFLTALRKGQQTMIGALRIWVETVQAVTPKLSGVYAPLTDKLPKLPNVSVPFAGKLPSPKEAVDSAYGLAEELLANQRKFAEAVLDTVAPLMPGYDQDVTSNATPKAAPKPVVVRTEPKPAAVVPAPKPAVVVKTEPKPAVVVKTEPKPAAVAPTAPELKAPAPKAPELKAPEFKAPEPMASAPKPSVPKAPEPTAPKAAAPKAATPKPPAPKRAPRTTPKRTPKSADAS
jgi:hypothetical protein